MARLAEEPSEVLGQEQGHFMSAPILQNGPAWLMFAYLRRVVFFPVRFKAILVGLYIGHPSETSIYIRARDAITTPADGAGTQDTR